MLIGLGQFFINRLIIPVSVTKRPPSVELRKDQKDIDSLPGYDLLDKILKGYVEEDKSLQEERNAETQGYPQNIDYRLRANCHRAGL